jgi:hypothetical protein
MWPFAKDLIIRLAQGQVEFVVVGEVSAILQGGGIHDAGSGYLLPPNA